jgi:hypothetical protein
VLGWSARGGTLALPSASLHLEALGASGEIALMPEPATGPIEVTRLAVRDDAAAPRFGPLVLSGRVSGLASKLAARGALRLRDGGPEVAFAFEEHEGAERFDSMAFSLGPAAFDAGSRDLLRLVPPLAAAFDVAGGTLAWRGELELPRGAEPRVRSHVSLADAVLATGALRVEGIAGSLGLASLTPLEISPSAIRFARAHVGPELSAGAAQLELAGDALRLRDLSARALGGTLSGDVSLPLASANGEAALRFEAISLESLARLLEIEALRAEGEISGALDAAFGAQGFSLRKGSLASVRPGTLRYRPELPPAALASAGGDTNVLLAALSDFRFERMRADVALAPEGVVAQLALDGRNPALQRGRPIELRARIAAPLPELLALRDAWQRLVRALSRAR